MHPGSNKMHNDLKPYYWWTRSCPSIWCANKSKQNIRLFLDCCNSFRFLSGNENESSWILCRVDYSTKKLVELYIVKVVSLQKVSLSIISN
ncbi:putative retrotransposon protein [Gossypium australe]|uniref:Putative retrotransposon protein n=1 Tax=Gossypium australe TaxID=47621 RepID=A0A5B6X1Q3_9ROSI|nr:putative retrotransposon protein [Gossypium australe]